VAILSGMVHGEGAIPKPENHVMGTQHRSILQDQNMIVVGRFRDENQIENVIYRHPNGGGECKLDKGGPFVQGIGFRDALELLVAYGQPIPNEPYWQDELKRRYPLDKNGRPILPVPYMSANSKLKGQKRRIADYMCNRQSADEVDFIQRVWEEDDEVSQSTLKTAISRFNSSGNAPFQLGLEDGKIIKFGLLQNVTGM
jgi:hypothetical protein